jgi:hypothetical protein
MQFWIKHPRSQEPDAMLTLAVYSVVATVVKFLFSDMTFGAVTFGDLDASVIAALLTPTLGAYAVRKHSQPPATPETLEEVESADEE